MKKTYLLTAFFIGSFVMNSQVKVRPGIRTGLNISNISNSVSEGTITSSKHALYIGAFANIKFSNFYQLQPELIYSQQGFKADRTTTSSRTNLNQLEVDLNYFSIGLANKLFIKKTGLHFIIGPSVDIKVNNIPNYFNNYNVSNTDNYAGIDIALFGGVGYEFPFGLSIEARYKNGLIDINGDNFNQSVTFDELNMNQVFQIGVAYSFSFK